MVAKSESCRVHDAIIPFWGSASAVSASRLAVYSRWVLHRRVAEVLERDGGSVGQLAYHYARSTESERALLYLERAGDEALSLHANAEAERWSRESITRATEAAYRVPLVDALRIRGMVLTEQKRLKEAGQVLERSLAMSRALPRPHAEVKALFAFGHLLCREGKDQEATARFQAALSLCAPQGERALRRKNRGGAGTSSVNRPAYLHVLA